MLSDYLEPNYDITCAPNGESALALKNLDSFQLVISDINMPGMPGYEFLREVKTLHPKIRVVLITAYNVDYYIRLAEDYGISNIIAKTIPFNFAELDAVVKGLVTGDIFGVDRFMKSDFIEIKNYVVKSSESAKAVREDLLQKLLKYVKNTGDLKLVLDEMVTNALYHSPKK